MFRSYVIILLAAGLFGCENGAGTGSSFADKATFSIVKAEAFGCESECNQISVSILVKNTSSSAICVPYVYNDESANGAAVIRYVGSDEAVTTYSPYDPNPFLSPRYKNDMIKLKYLPQYVVPPHSNKDISFTMEDKFPLKRKPAVIIIRFMGFPCSQVDKNAGSIKIEDLSASLTFSG